MKGANAVAQCLKNKKTGIYVSRNQWCLDKTSNLAIVKRSTRGGSTGKLIVWSKVVQFSSKPWIEGFQCFQPGCR